MEKEKKEKRRGRAAQKLRVMVAGMLGREWIITAILMALKLVA